MARDKLAEYRRKRDFAATAEPAGGRVAESGAEPVFVVQIHDASTLHFDFRLEVDGVLRSWAVPKGPSDDPRDKRLAIPTEDHPLEYRDFEGVVAGGEYGAGTVIIWDEGTFQNLTTDRGGREVAALDALGKGHLSFQMHGSKLRGGYALTRIRSRNRDEAWLLVKEDDRRGAPHGTPDPRRARSARTGRTLKQVADEAPSKPGEG